MTRSPFFNNNYLDPFYSPTNMDMEKQINACLFIIHDIFTINLN
jgi:hypothetical protein